MKSSCEDKWGYHLNIQQFRITQEITFKDEIAKGLKKLSLTSLERCYVCKVTWEVMEGLNTTSFIAHWNNEERRVMGDCVIIVFHLKVSFNSRDEVISATKYVRFFKDLTPNKICYSSEKYGRLVLYNITISSIFPKLPKLKCNSNES